MEKQQTAPAPTPVSGAQTTTVASTATGTTAGEQEPHHSHLTKWLLILVAFLLTFILALLLGYLIGGGANNSTPDETNIESSDSTQDSSSGEDINRANTSAGDDAGETDSATATSELTVSELVIDVPGLDASVDFPGTDWTFTASVEYADFGGIGVYDIDSPLVFSVDGVNQLDSAGEEYLASFEFETSRGFAASLNTVPNQVALELDESDSAVTDLRGDLYRIQSGDTFSYVTKLDDCLGESLDECYSEDFAYTSAGDIALSIRFTESPTSHDLEDVDRFVAGLLGY